MADFKPTKIDLLTINNGKGKYINGIDSVQADTINAVVEGTAWVQALGTNQPNNSEADIVGTPSVSIEILSDGTPRFKFDNLKGEKGDTVPVVQETGQSTDKVMSQKAVTEAINNAAQIAIYAAQAAEAEKAVGYSRGGEIDAELKKIKMRLAALEGGN